MNFIKKLFCKHDWGKIDWRFAENKTTVYSERLYKCSKCGKEKWVDGRYDPEDNRPYVYYYILRDYSWWQQVSKQIYDTWTQPKKITTYVLSEEEIEDFNDVEWRDLIEE